MLYVGIFMRVSDMDNKANQLVGVGVAANIENRKMLGRVTGTNCEL